MQNWVIIEERYLDYLRAVESRIPFSDYGANKFKPFFGALFELGDLVYVTQISHAQERHERMRNSLDFIKIYLPDNKFVVTDRLVAVVNLNYMFPVPKSLVQNLDYKDIEQHRSFKSAAEKSRYIDLLTKELKKINALGIACKAKKLYELRKNYPHDRISLRCLDFSALELVAHNYAGITTKETVSV